MAGIDNNTVLYLRGDEYKDLSLYSSEKVITNTGTSIVQDGKFGPGIQLTNGVIRITNGSSKIDWSKDFTIEWWENALGTIDGNSALLITRVATGLIQSGILLAHGGTLMYTGVGVWSGILGATIKDSEANVWHHWALVKKGTTWTSYKDGTLFWTATSDVSPGSIDGGITLGAWVDESGDHTGYNAIISELRLSNVARYTDTFTPHLKPYTTVNVDIIKQLNNQIIFSATKKSTDENINRVDVLINDNVIQSYDSNFEEITYIIDDTTCVLGSNNIEIRAYYFEDYYESKTTVYNKKDKIDGNTLLYLRGDSFLDLSPNNHAIENKGGITTTSSTNFGSALNLTTTSTRLHIDTMNLPGDNFTIDWWEQTQGTVSSNVSLVTNLTEEYPDTSVASFILGRSSGGQNSLWARDISGTSGWTLQTFKIGDYKPSEWIHKALVYDGTTFYSYVNGVLYSSGTCNGLYTLNTGIDINAFRAGNACYNAHVESLRISNNIRYTGNFEPPMKPYTSVMIDILEQEENQVNFSVTKSSVNESISKVEIVLNGEVIQTYTEGYDNVNYSVDKNKCLLGSNDIEIRAYYYNDFYDSVSFTYVNKLSDNPSLPEVVDALNKMKTNYSNIIDELYKILINKGCNVAVEDKRMRKLVNKVEEFTDNIKQKLTNALTDRRIENVSTENSFDELIGEINNITDFPKWCVTSGGYWITGANMTTARRFLSSGVIGTSIYCVGGYTGSSSSVNQRYDTLTNTWTAMTAMTASRYGHVVTASKGKLYAMGGYSSATTNYCYDPSTNAWTTMTAIPASSYYSATAEANGIIYLISGYVGGSLATTNRTYDVSTNTWSTIKVLPAAVYSPSVGVYKNKIYVVGGYNGGAKTTNYCYDITNGNWTTLKAKTNTVYRAGQVAPVIDGKLYVIGGTGSATYSTVNECYDIENNTWSTLTVLPTGRYGLTTQVVDGCIYCIGGYTGSYANVNQCFLPL